MNSSHYKVSGNYNYTVTVDLKGQLPYQSCLITLLAFSDSSLSKPLSISVYWQKLRGQEVTNLSSHLSNTYQVEAVDVGDVLVANVNSESDGFKGVARVVFS